MRPNREKFRPEGNLSRSASEKIDGLVGIFSPKTAYKRKAYRFAYDAVESMRTRKKRKGLGGTGDTHLTENNLYRLREINRELTRNNPLIEGMFETERDGILGAGPTIQARTLDKALNDEIEAAWKEEMLDSPCDVTERFNFNQFLGMAFLSYRRDGDLATIFLDDKMQAVEGEQIGTPYDAKNPENFEIINGIAYSKKTKAVIGYYIGESDRKWGYIKPGSYNKYKAETVHLMFNPKRFSQSRGKPVLTSAIDFIDKITGYVDAELVAAKVNACFSVFISKKDSEGAPAGYTGGISSSGVDEDNNRLEKVQPGTIMYGEDGEEARGIGQTRPGSLFDPFILRMLTFIGRPMCMPLMLITLDFAGATFMNARIAYQKVQDAWQREQEWIIKPYVSRVWRWKLARLLEKKLIKTDNEKVYHHEIFCKRWPYVDPFKESKADEQQLKNKTTTRTAICARQGDDFEEVIGKRAAEEVLLKKEGLVLDDR